MRTNARKRTDDAARADFCAAQMAKRLHPRVRADFAIFKNAVRADFCAARQLRILQNNIDFNFRVPRGAHFAAKINARRIGNSHAPRQHRFRPPLPQNRFRPRQLGQSIDSGGFGFFRAHGRRRRAAAECLRRQIGQIHFAAVAGANAGEILFQLAGGRGERSRKHFANVALRAAGVAVFDDGGDFCAVARDASVSRRIGGAKSQQRETRRPGVSHPPQSGNGKQRGVRAHYQRNAVVAEHLQAAAGGVRGAARIALHGELRGGETRARGVLNRRRIGRNDDDDSPRLQAERRGKNMREQRLASERQKRLRRIRAQPAAAPGGEDDHIRGHSHIRHFTAPRARGRYRQIRRLVIPAHCAPHWSFRRKPESSVFFSPETPQEERRWIPAFAGMTSREFGGVAENSANSAEISPLLPSHSCESRGRNGFFFWKIWQFCVKIEKSPQ